MAVNFRSVSKTSKLKEDYLTSLVYTSASVSNHTRVSGSTLANVNLGVIPYNSKIKSISIVAMTDISATATNYYNGKLTVNGTAIVDHIFPAISAGLLSTITPTASPLVPANANIIFNISANGSETLEQVVVIVAYEPQRSVR